MDPTYTIAMNDDNTRIRLECSEHGQLGEWDTTCGVWEPGVSEAIQATGTEHLSAHHAERPPKPEKGTDDE